MNFDTILEDCKSRYRKFEGRIEPRRKPKSFEKAILEKKEQGVNPIISEIKFSSPLGKIREQEDPKAIAREMINGGACGLSVLTEEKYFGGSLGNLSEVSEISSIPVLRKDFIFDEAQVAESYYYGADSLLLIASFLDDAALKKFIEKSRMLGIEPLVEIHSLEDIARAEKAGTRIYAINNRDKDTLRVDLNRSKVFSEACTPSSSRKGIKISSSGISTLRDLKFVLKYCDAALIGSAIMKGDIAEKVREFVYGSI
ncbi:MAG: indole-3-glycerol-phosphate synthase [Candidatus Hydrothermarchaeota archaeon]|nr:indole-3-glycerol-phosphate synthase [Candidatus Hydrothermarchaeota archaeon]